MREVELLLVTEGNNATVYTIQFSTSESSEFNDFYNRFKSDAEYNEDLVRIVSFINKIADNGALERYSRPEGKYNDHVYALPVISSILRLYCLRLSNKILILGNGGVKKTRTYNEDDDLKGYVMTLQKFETILQEEQKKGTVKVLERQIIISKTIEL